MVQLGGFEPPTSGATNQRSNQLSYNCTRSGCGSFPDEASLTDKWITIQVDKIDRGRKSTGRSTA